MKVNNKEQVFNLFDTNGRRKDIINAYNIYTNILEQVYEESESGTWGRYPNESTQLRFYELAIQNSPEVFKLHPKYDNFIKAMEDPRIKLAFDKGDISYLKKDKTLKQLYADLDSAIEGRARHYTSNLVKIGLTDEQRQISPVGKAWIHGKKLRRSRFERLLPIDDTNLMFLRQLLKLRVYTKEEEKFYSPMIMAVYILLKYPRVSEDLFITMIQMLNPYLPKEEPSDFINEFLGGQVQKLEREYVPFIVNEAFDEIVSEPTPMSNDVFARNFSSGKSEKTIKVYREFYHCLVKFNSEQTEDNLLKIVELFSNNQKKSMINKAFGFGRNVFSFDKSDKTNVKKFLELNEDLDILTNENLNEKLFLQFLASKRHDQIQEYGDVTRRVIKVTGIISFKNGVVELAQRDLWTKFFSGIDLESLIFGNTSPEAYTYYEKRMDSPFLNHLTLEEIFEHNEESINQLIIDIQNELNLSSDEEVRKTLFNKTSKAFIEHIETNYSKEKILEILPLFSDRSNDSKIQKMVAENTDVPTIFEYIVGIAWYHMSSKKFDLFSSFNLSMSADFEPETHAGGGTGDIVIDYGDQIFMLEVTLMNKNAQKRGEWEPVLRHATNLTIESAPKKVTTLFIADELDKNTINIWRAVATVPLQSSKEMDRFAKTVTIMPLKNEELAKMLENEKNETELYERIEKSFNQLSKEFNMEWRNEIIEFI
ncbi:AlwI family type II restriction endonuclease [Mesobacillus maritimus]|uniref:AlwI family type II restriction endonuclease n=1 Tax=Mesobacillus maritimus TaxID=1643336 RepID=UPI0020421935|nr:AlwI family type II restriction endonuclease [Mesobacillus maritimus]MCM3585017.1 AlwI family type II restriction endonuclease [Mesobacillus maritimus]